MAPTTAEPQTFDETSETKQATDRNAAAELRRGPEAGNDQFVQFFTYISVRYVI